MFQFPAVAAESLSKIFVTSLRSRLLGCFFCLLVPTAGALVAQDQASQQGMDPSQTQIAEQHPTDTSPSTVVAQTAPAAPPAPPIPDPGTIPDGVSISNPVQAPPAPNTPAAIEQSQPSFLLHVATDQASREYYDGEQISLTIRCEVDAYIYVLYTQADGQTYVVLPNSGSSPAKVPAKQPVRIPGEKDLFRWTVSAPFGKEHLKVIASKVRIPTLEQPEMRQRQATPLQAQQIEQIVGLIRSEIPRDQWTEFSLDITTLPGINPRSPYFGKRYGLFFSVPFQLISKTIQEANNDPERTGNLGLPTITDSMLMQRTLRLVKGLDESMQFPDPNSANVQEFFDSLPYRHVMKTAITEDMPGKVKAGDTVIIYFSGHGATFNDPQKPNGKQSYLVPSDVIDVYGLLAMRKLNQQDKLSEYERRRLNYVESLLTDEKIVFDYPDGEKWKALSQEERVLLGKRVSRLLIEKTAITESEFNQWLQSLSHCRVIVMLDACMSGGFAPSSAGEQTKGSPFQFNFSTPTNPADFQFLQPQLQGLKSLGDVNTALVTAARISETSLQAKTKTASDQSPDPADTIMGDIYGELSNNKILDQIYGTSKLTPTMQKVAGIFTYYMSQALLSSSGSLDIEHAGHSCDIGMQRFFQSAIFREINDQLKKDGKSPLTPHHPVFFDNCRPKVLLKP